MCSIFSSKAGSHKKVTEEGLNFEKQIKDDVSLDLFRAVLSTVLLSGFSNIARICTGTNFCSSSRASTHKESKMTYHNHEILDGCFFKESGL